MDRWIAERAPTLSGDPHNTSFNLYDIKTQGMKDPVAEFTTPELATRCAALLNAHGERADG